ncbi:MAG: cyclic nucleotide-binding protein, partial [Rhodospirillales bacterium]|nr:cyclic nucleotide-binding protein [Rhodospirillales bacterium]
MSLNEEVDLLRKIPLFAKIDPSKLKLLAFTSERLTYGAGQELFH